MQGEWRAAAILNEGLADTLRFAAWYLSEGAHSLLLMFDNPQDPAIGVLDPDPRITCIPCTAEFWRDLGMAPDANFPKRQNAALTWAYRQTREPWFLNVDADEFLYVEGRSIADLLAAEPADVEAVRIITAEVVTPVPARAALQFRLPMERPAAKRVYRRDAPLFGPRRRGLIGHPQGKSATRTGLADVRVRQHWVERAGGGIVAEREIGAAERCFLLHMIGQDFAAWRRKLDWRSGSRGFTTPLTERIAAARAEPDAEARLQALHDAMHKMDDAALARLEAEGARLELALDLDAPARGMFGAAFAPALT
ncbi:glycosyltransferase family 2 protein [Pseudodonghicola flavimaris]|uniref:Glycosyltransferase family 2 protein n=1 Tax=Pseudodonghicola flavimaris TaxID=3050036 RepID=A0ABT7F218_9RHOB|nr:glycosyltransferase family 2 protein [Pseudodonghicola flavimaris]MDK3018652.1 glycosyltransferase family 2 protein [Pseudodonghicola flavimaris]